MMARHEVLTRASTSHATVAAIWRSDVATILSQRRMDRFFLMRPSTRLFVDAASPLVILSPRQSEHRVSAAVHRNAAGR